MGYYEIENTHTWWDYQVPLNTSPKKFRNHSKTNQT